MAEINHLEDALSTSVKFYASLTRELAKGNTPIRTDEDGNNIYIEPGSICFVSDKQGNSIFLNKRLFGDGAVASSTGGGSTGGGGGITEVNLDDLVIIEKDGLVLKTLADYFNADGSIISDSLIINTLDSEGNQVPAITITSSGIKIGEETVATLEYVNSAVSNNNATIIALAENAAKEALKDVEETFKEYADKINGSIYKILGSIDTYANLEKIANPKAGDVYNVIGAYGTIGSASYIPPGTNYVYVEVTNPLDSKYPGYWDALGGTIDLSGYQDSATTNSNISNALDQAKGYADGLKTDIQSTYITPLQNSVSGIDSRVTTNTSNISINATKIADNTKDIETNTTNITNISTQLTWQ